MDWEPAEKWPTDEIGHRHKRADYLLTDGRKRPEECFHSQFLDVAVEGAVNFTYARCLDCGAAVKNGNPRTVTDDLPNALLSDEDLLAQRAVHRLIWFGNVSLPTGVAPGI